MKTTSKRQLSVESLENRTLLAANVTGTVEAPVSSPIVDEHGAPFDPGDANGDGRFDHSDLLQVFQAGKYESDQPADWSEGDWTDDGHFNSQDLVAAMQAGNFDRPVAAHREAAIIQQTRVNLDPFGFSGPPGQLDGGSAQLVRHNDGIDLTVNAHGVFPGMYTVWYVVFNNPDACEGGCGGDDLRRAGVDASVGFLTGHVVGNGDHANFSGTLKEGDTTDALFGPALQEGNAKAAEIHFIGRYHGKVDPEALPEAIHSFEPGLDCDDGVCDVLAGDTGDVLAGAFLPPGD